MRKALEFFRLFRFFRLNGFFKVHRISWVNWTVSLERGESQLIFVVELCRCCLGSAVTAVQTIWFSVGVTTKDVRATKLKFIRQTVRARDRLEP